MIKIGFIGFGYFSKLRYKILKSYTNVSITGFYDDDVDDELPLQKYKNYKELINQSDALIISTPPFYTSFYTIEALKKNKHIFAEKPPSTTIEDLKKIKALHNDTVLAYGFNHRLHDSIQKIYEIIESKSMGKVLWMRGRYGKEVDENYVNTWRCDKKLNGGGIVIDQGIHLLDIMQQIAGEFDRTQSLLSCRYLKKEGIEDNAFINLYSSSTNISASMHSTITQWRYLFSFEIFLEKGSLILNGLRTNSGKYGDEVLVIKPENGGSYGGDTNDTKIEFTENTSWKKEMDEFLSSLVNKKQYEYANINDAIDVMKLIKKIYNNAIWID